MKREDYQLDFFWSLLSDAELHSLKGKNTRIRFIHVAGFEVVVVLGGGKDMWRRFALLFSRCVRVPAVGLPDRVIVVEMFIFAVSANYAQLLT